MPHAPRAVGFFACFGHRFRRVHQRLQTARRKLYPSTSMAFALKLCSPGGGIISLDRWLAALARSQIEPVATLSPAIGDNLWGRAAQATLERCRNERAIAKRAPGQSKSTSGGFLSYHSDFLGGSALGTGREKWATNADSQNSDVSSVLRTRAFGFTR